MQPYVFQLWSLFQVVAIKHWAVYLFTYFSYIEGSMSIIISDVKNISLKNKINITLDLIERLTLSTFRLWWET